MRLAPNRRYQSVVEFKAQLMEASSLADSAQRYVYTENGSIGGKSGQVADSKPRSGRWISLGVIAMLLVCVLVVVIGVVGYTMLMPGLGDATATQLRLSLAQTGTALAILVGQTPTPSSPPPSATFTLMVPTTEAALITPTLSPTISPSPTEQAATATIEYEYWQACSGTYLSRLRVGDRASVSTDPPLPNRVRSEPDTDSNILGYLQVGEKMEILDGPECKGGWVWWYVQSLDTTMLGWTAEGDDTNYWLVPLPR
jgi:hypothetical protein